MVMKSLLERGKKEKMERKSLEKNPEMSAFPRLRKRKPSAFKAKIRTTGSWKTVTKIVVPPRKVDSMVKYFGGEQ
jgi:hypothetical protein